MARPGPLLLDLEFPLPPSFIPVSPGPATPNFFNPPPSRPPETPLPPVPGPSRISDSDTLLFLSSSRSGSRRSSKLSLNNGAASHNRDSFASTRSDSLLSTSTSSLRSSPRTPDDDGHRPSLVFSIAEVSSEPPLDNDLLSKSPLVLGPDEDVDLAVPVPPVMPSSSGTFSPRSSLGAASNRRRESIALSSVDMPDIENDDADFAALPRRPATPDSRAPSPDIATILATTPRPRLTSVASRTALSRRASKVRSRTTSLGTGNSASSEFDPEPWEEESFIDDYGVVRGSVYSVKSGYGFPTQSDEHDHYEYDDDDVDPVFPEADEDSDSSLDLHTIERPAAAILSSPSPPRPPAPPADVRDTPNRRLLRGGIGLTTGLGWSDSEDEDAPSALTRRISNLNLGSGGLRSVRSMGVLSSRAPSSLGEHDALPDERLDVCGGGSRMGMTGRRTRSPCRSGGVPRRKGSAPPTAWAGKAQQQRRPGGRRTASDGAPRIVRTPSEEGRGGGGGGYDVSYVYRGGWREGAASCPGRVSHFCARGAGCSASWQRTKEKPLPRPPSLALKRNASGGSWGWAPPARRRMRVRHRPLRSMPVAPPHIHQHRPAPPVASSSTPSPGVSFTSVGYKYASPASAYAAQAQAQLQQAKLAELAQLAQPIAQPQAQYASEVPTSPQFASRPSPSLQSAGRTPPSPLYAGTPPATPSTPLYDSASGVPRPRPRTGTGMVYRHSNNTSMYTPGTPGGRALRPPGAPIAL
ncbi:hypothetical protein C8J57DRAFT_1297957 [Mycena rebaudengoi]|nr:hypothetical protein C8J57DRAFT_1297957 [Mycena rebaudengoi]